LIQVANGSSATNYTSYDPLGRTNAVVLSACAAPTKNYVSSVAY